MTSTVPLALWNAYEDSLRVLFADDPERLASEIRRLRFIRDINPPAPPKPPSLFRRAFCRKLN